MKKLLVVSPHADDETLGAGGTLLRYSRNGNKIYWINVTNAKEEYGYAKEEELQRRGELERVAARYGVEALDNLELTPAGLDEYPMSELVQIFSERIKRIQPNIVLIPFQYDVHSDHRIVFDAVYSCTKSFRYPEIEKILCMEILSETDYAVPAHGFVPNYYVDISAYMEEKIDILKEYKSEIKPSPFPRNEEAVRGLARYRAAGCNVKYAEGFHLLKAIEK